MERQRLKLGLAVQRVVISTVTCLFFYAVVTPIGLMMRAGGRDLLRLKRDPGAKSYWIERAPPGPAPNTMKNRF